MKQRAVESKRQNQRVFLVGKLSGTILPTSIGGGAMDRKARWDMRREQLLGFVRSDMSAAEWMRLNRMSPATFYLWTSRFREAEPEVFGPPPSPAAGSR